VPKFTRTKIFIAMSRKTSLLSLFWSLAFCLMFTHPCRAADIIPIASQEPSSLIILVKGDFAAGDDQKFANIAIGTHCSLIPSIRTACRTRA
jgi:hypothetical protein